MSEKNNKTNQSNPKPQPSKQPTKPLGESQENYSVNNKSKRGPNPPVNRTSPPPKPQKK